ncbi:Wadjet anti-phage system protein JetA family protein [Brucella sp. 458]|uniref:Wadjet anti-phage system protein JetA family protein n=1 Tax=Brucella sp. 458 TaxID=2821140 RepID=UPI001FFCE8E2|nr:Wadjet anti-phage system protein JetA family protein [Brucella sp. 458]
MLADTSTLRLFGQLEPDIFTLFSGGNRMLYERSLLAVYNRLYRSDLHFPTQAEVVNVIYDCLSREPGLWTEEEAAVDLDRLVARTGRRVRRRRVEGVNEEATGIAISRSRHIYNRMLQTGWLDEASYGLKTTVEMPSGAMRLAEFLCSLKEGIAEQLGGLVIEVRNAIRAVEEKPAENALGLNKAARDAAGFGRYLRSVLSALRDIDRRVLSSETLADRLRRYFEDFVERVLLRDYTAITTTAHPYRHRRSILTALDRLEDSSISTAAIADAYLEAKLAQTTVEACDLVYEDISSIRRVFGRIEDVFEAIQRHRARLETRLRNVVRYAGRRTSFLQRSEHIIRSLDDMMAGRIREMTIRGPIEHRIPFLAPGLLAKPRGVRAVVSGSDLSIPPPDPIMDLRRMLEKGYLDRLIISPAKVSRFLELRIPPHGEASGASLAIETVDDFLAFEALRLLVAGGLGKDDNSSLATALRDRFKFIRDDAQPISNDWLDCPGFIVKRLGGIILEAENAS